MNTPIDGEITFERRRYGRTTYTWAYLWYRGEQHQLGDPSPSITFPRKELSQAVADRLEQLGVSSNGSDDGRYSRPIKIF